MEVTSLAAKSNKVNQKNGSKYEEESQNKQDIKVRAEVNRVCKSLDTIEVRWQCKLNKPDEIDIFKNYSRRRDKNEFVFHQYKAIRKSSNGTVIVVTYCPYVWGGKSYLYTEFSIPKLITGNNYLVNMGDQDFIGKIEKELAIIFIMLGIQPLNLFLADIVRIDFCKNFQVGDQVNSYASFVKTRSYSRRKRFPYQNNEHGTIKPREIDNGVSFTTKLRDKRTSVYNKQEECGDIRSKGILRLESSFRSADAIEQLTGIKHFTLKDLSMGLVNHVLRTELHTLGLDSDIAVKENFRKMLIEAGISRRLINSIMGFVACDYQNPGLSSEVIGKIACVGKSTVTKYRRLLKDHGLSYSEDAESHLPPLRIDTEEAAEKLCEIVAKSYSNTCEPDEEPGEEQKKVHWVGKTGGRTQKTDIGLISDHQIEIFALEVPLNIPI